MTQGNMPHNIAPLRNVTALTALADRLINRSMNLPGMATFHGPSGFGKTFACVYATIKHRAVAVQIKSVWTRKKLCEAILKELSIPPAKTIGDMLDQICEALAVSGRPLFLDEADYLTTPAMIEIIRDIYEGSEAPIILIGEELLPQKLQKWERVHGRMLDHVKAEPGQMQDLVHLAKIYAPSVQITSDLRDRILMVSQGSIRRICVNLDQAREIAHLKGLDAVDLKAWGKKEFFTGQPPAIRRFGSGFGEVSQ